MELLIIFLLIALNGALVLSEMSIVASRKARLQHWSDKGRPGADTALALANEPGHFLSTTQIGITVIGIVSGALAADSPVRGSRIGNASRSVLSSWSAADRTAAGSSSCAAGGASANQVRVGRPVGGVATARNGFEAAPIQHGELAAVVLDQSTALQGHGGGRNADAAHAEHIGEELLCHSEAVGMRSILAHQQPTGQARADQVKAQAGGGRSQLGHQDIDVAVQDKSQCSAVREFVSQRARTYAPCSARALYHRMQWHSHHAQGELHAEHAFATHHSDFQPTLALNARNQRDEAIGREVSIPSPRRGLT